MREDDGFAIHRLLRHSRAGLNLTPYVIPAQAGIHSNVFGFLKASDSKTKSWIPACARMTALLFTGSFVIPAKI
jgi:hypothetical protein